MAKWGWVVAGIVTIAILGCAKQKPKRNGLFDAPRPGEEVEDEPKTFSPEDHFDTGMDYYSGGKFKEAEVQFMMALQERPDYFEPRNALGYVYYFKALMEIHAGKAKEAMELHEKAVGHFLKALEKNPNKVEPYIGLAMVNYDEFQYFTPQKNEYRIRALGYLDKAKKIAPNDPNVQANVGFHEAKYFLAEKAYSEAAPLLKQVVACEGVDPMTRVQAHPMLGGCLYMLGDLEGAIQFYRRYLELFPNADDRDDITRIIADIQAQLLEK